MTNGTRDSWTCCTSCIVINRVPRNYTRHTQVGLQIFRKFSTMRKFSATVNITDNHRNMWISIYTYFLLKIIVLQVHTTPNRGSLHPVGSFLRWEGGRPWIDQVTSLFLLSARKASEICLQASERTVGESLTGLLQSCYIILQ